jgi:FAD/FMN-containing dehydrogenase
VGTLAKSGINRRFFLRAAGLGAGAAALAACGSQQPATGKVTPTPSTSGPPGSAPASSAAAPVPMDYAALRAKLAGSLVTPDDSGYASARKSYNPLYDGRRPGAVALCANASDVAACVSAAVASGTPIAARGGGHSYVGASTPDGSLVVDLGKLSTVDVRSDGTVVLGPGARLGDVYSALAGAGRALPAGSCPTVGVAGLALGGGIGVLARKYGLTCDRLAEATLITPDGVTHTVNAGSEPDLFWALRGAGGGNLGIVTSFTFDTVPAPATTVFTLTFPAGSVSSVLGAFQHWIAAAPDEMWATCNISTAGSPSCRISGCYLGAPGAAGDLLNQLVSPAGAQPSSRFVEGRSYGSAMKFFAGSGAKEAFVASSRVLSAPVSDPDPIVAACTRPGMNVIFDGLGGQVGRVAATDTVFPHRSALATVQIYQKTTSSAQASAAAQVTATRDQLTGVLGAGAYVNYLDTSTPKSDYYGGNLDRLRSIVGKYDPDGVFSTLG